MSPLELLGIGAAAKYLLGEPKPREKDGHEKLLERESIRREQDFHDQFKKERDKPSKRLEDFFK